MMSIKTKTKKIKSLFRVQSFLRTLLAGSLILSHQAFAYRFCDSQKTTGESSWDIADEGSATIYFDFKTGDATTPIKKITSVHIEGLHQYVGDLTSTLVAPSGDQVKLFKLGMGTQGCSRADFDLTFRDGSGLPITKNTASTYCFEDNSARDRGSEPLSYPQPYLPHFPSVLGEPGLRGTAPPIEKLASLVGKPAAVVGQKWGLTVADAWGSDIGTITNACVDMDFGAITYDMWVSSDAACSDKKDVNEFDFGDTVYVCHIVSNEATENFLYNGSMTSPNQNIDLELSGTYSAKYGGSGTIKKALRTFTAGRDDLALSGTDAQTFTFSGSVTGTFGNDQVSTPESVKITVNPPNIKAVDDSFSASGFTGFTTTSVLLNDSIDGQTANATNVNLTPLTSPLIDKITMDDNTGNITIAASTPAGVYDYKYKICDKINTSTCATAKATITVTEAELVAQDIDEVTFGGLKGGTSSTSVLINDTLAGNTLITSGTISEKITLIQNSVSPPPLPNAITMDENGFITVKAKTPASDYTVNYTICEKLNSTNCKSANAFIKVTKPLIVTNASSFTLGGLQGGKTTSVLSKSTIDGQRANINTAIILVSESGVLTPPTSGAITMDNAGIITVTPDTTAGTYTYAYKICDTFNKDSNGKHTNCTNAETEVIVTPADVKSTNIVLEPVSGAQGGETNDSVFSNPAVTIGGVQATEDNAILGSIKAIGKATQLSKPITIGSDGKANIPAGTPAGEYTFTYRVCEKLNPNNCSPEQTITVTVTPATIDTTTVGTVELDGYKGGTFTQLESFTKIDGKPATSDDIKIKDFTLETATQGPTYGSITVDANGDIQVTKGTTAGTYTYTYNVCEKLNPTNCKPAKVKVKVTSAVIETNSSTVSVNGFKGGDSSESILKNDTIGGESLKSVIDKITVAATPKSSLPTDGSISLNPDGTVKVAPGTTTGSYTFSYKICEKVNPSNCKENEFTVVVTPPAITISAPTLAVDNVNGSIGGHSTKSVFEAVKVGGEPGANHVDAFYVDTNYFEGPQPTAGTISIKEDGTIKIKPGTTAGTYTYKYKVCVPPKGAANCAIAEVTITVDYAVIIANETDEGTISNKNDTTTTTSVVKNDTLNGQPAVIGTSIGNVTLTSGTLPPGISMDGNGIITVIAGTPSDLYTFNYTICEVLNPSNCSTNEVKIEVIDADITAVAANLGTVTSFTTDVTTLTSKSAIIGDTIDGSPVVIDPAQSPTATFEWLTNPLPSNITRKPDGTVTIKAGTPADIYQLTYKICQKNSPDNCATASASVTVTPPNFNSGNVTLELYDGYKGGETIGSIFDNMNLGEKEIVPANVITTLTPTGAAATQLQKPITFDVDGKANIPAGTPAGEYKYLFVVCEKNNPTNCSEEKTVTVKVGKPIITANTSIYNVDGYSGEDTPSVLINVKISDDKANTDNVVVKTDKFTSGAKPLNGSISIDGNGKITVAPQTTAGTYVYTYEVCDKINPTNCKTGNTEIVVKSADFTLVDINISAQGMSGKTLDIGNLLGSSKIGTTDLVRDKLDKVIITLIPGSTVPTEGGISLTTDGTVVVSPGTTAGQYKYKYKVCEKLNSGNCAEKDFNITVSKAILKGNAFDISPPLDGFNGQDSAKSVLSNDTIGGKPVLDNLDKIVFQTNTFKPKPNTSAPKKGNITISDSGIVTVASETTAGSYTYTYTWCEVLNSDNCVMSDVTIEISAATITAVNDNTGEFGGLEGGTSGVSVLSNDTLGTESALVAGVINSKITLKPGDVLLDGKIITGTSITMDSNTGLVTIAPNTNAGTYTYNYKVCEKLNTSNCAEAAATIKVNKPEIVVNDDSFSIDGFVGATSSDSILSNDTISGKKAVADNNVKIREFKFIGQGSVPIGISKKPDGRITVAGGTPAGDYEYEYEICDTFNTPTNCKTAKTTVTVTAAKIAAQDTDLKPVIVSAAKGEQTQNGIIDYVLLDDNPTTKNSVTITTTPTGAAKSLPIGSSIVFDETGKATVSKGVPAGTYKYKYKACENLNPTNCSEEKEVGIIVKDANLTLEPKSFTLDGFNGQESPSIFIGNTIHTDTPLTKDNATAIIAPIANPPAKGGITIKNGVITVDKQTTAGIYKYNYKVCEILNSSNCKTSTVDITVTQADFDPPTKNVILGPVNGYNGATTEQSIFDYITINKELINKDSVTITATLKSSSTQLPQGNIIIGKDGKAAIKNKTPQGSYVYNYTICEILNPTNCYSGEATVIVNSTFIKANPDQLGTQDGIVGGTTSISVLDNDMLDGKVLNKQTKKDVTLHPGKKPTPEQGSFSMNKDGSITVAPGTSAGKYIYQYKICAVLNPDNCSSSYAKINIEHSDILVLIEKDLKNILDDDFANTLKSQSNTMNSYSSSALQLLKKHGKNTANNDNTVCLAKINAKIKKESIEFDVASDSLTARSETILDDIARTLIDCGVTQFEVAGHTDNVGSSAYNSDLSNRRAQAVVVALAKRNVDTSKVIAKGYGDSQPIGDNTTTEGRALNRRVEFIAIDTDFMVTGIECDNNDLQHNVKSKVNDNTSMFNGKFNNRRYDCTRQEWVTIESTISYSRSENGILKSQINSSYRREWFVNENSVRGWFIGGYGSNNDVTKRAKGKISGYGINAGVFGATKFSSGLFVDSYLGVAAGKTLFSLDFDKALGTIKADGDYTYYAGFAGAALSGDMKLESTQLTPRVGVNYTYSPSRVADVTVQLNHFSQNTNMKLDSMNGGDFFAEVRAEKPLNDGKTSIAVTPKVSCYRDLSNSSSNKCSYGGSFEISGTDTEEKYHYSLKVSGNKSENTQNGSISGSIKYKVDKGIYINSQSGISSDGNVSVGTGLNVDY